MKRLLILFAFVCPVLGFAQQNVRYEYMTIMQFGVPAKILISKSDGTYLEISVKDEVGKDIGSLVPLLKRISENEENGWEFLALNSNFVLMRKKKE